MRVKEGFPDALLRAIQPPSSQAAIETKRPSMNSRSAEKPSPARDALAPASPRALQATADHRDFVTALARGLELLSCFRIGETSLSNVDLSQMTKLPKSTVSRLTFTLTALGYLIHVKETGKYRLGTACLALGSAMLTKLHVREVAWPLMHELAQSSGMSVSLMVRDKLSMLYLDHCRSTATLSFRAQAGSRLPIATTAAGRAWLATAPKTERAQVVDELRRSSPGGWPQLNRKVEDAVREYSQYGVAFSFGDWNKRVHAIARTFDPGEGLPLICLNLGGTSEVAPEHLLNEGREQLISLTARLESVLARTTKRAQGPATGKAIRAS
jgi:DNA-binding IclR family transcriptional regulator